ncbi:PAAR domain-containing protein [Acinetobacter gerneri]|jgi:hypothetical protein|uniref:PAAR domain-containing protein n=1 Tax=Acinetobacter gerneri TaxID=202952 RepID=UPI0023F533E0|nr:PAAR domain-containing protein [Acinetobacter gerneri]MCH4246067.1 PAAR domain-containing protein [Acinetobacter gerneri]
MRRYFILEGDLTSAGGIVQRHTGSASTTSWHGRVVSNIGDQVICPACQSIGVIQASEARLSVHNKGNNPALNDDICICKCRPPPKLIHSQTVFSEEVSAVANVTSLSNRANNPQSSVSNQNNNFAQNKEQYEISYIERNKTDYVKFRNVLPPYEPDKFGKRGGGVLLQMGAGACDFIVTYIVKGIELFVTVSYIPPVLNQEATIYPSASLKIYKQKIRKFEEIQFQQLKKDSGYWDTGKGKEPVGFCKIQLPKPDLDLIKVVLEMGYEAKLDGGVIVPMPRFVTHEFTLTSGSRRVK